MLSIKLKHFSSPNQKRKSSPLHFLTITQLFSTNAMTDVTKVELVELLLTLKDIVVT